MSTPTDEELKAAAERGEDLILNGPRTETLHGTPIGRHDAVDPKTGMQKDYVVLSDAERAKGFVRPVRTRYLHTKCGTTTTMGLKLSETYARQPDFYSGTFCCSCKKHFPVGADGEFIWDDGSGEKVGT